MKNHSFNHRWRQFATGCAFLFFMAGGLIATLLLGPLLRLWPGSSQAKDFRVQRLIHYFFRLFMWGLVASRAMDRFQVTGKDKIGPGPHFFIANHPTLIDVVAIFSCLPQCDCLVKSALWNHFYLRGVIRAAGYIPNHNPLDLLERCEQSFRAGRSLLIFPEGTRSPADGLNPFTRGVARIALRTRIPVTPILIRCTPPLLHKSQTWHQVPAHPPILSIQFQQPLALLDSTMSDPTQARLMTAQIEAYFRKELPIDLC